MSHKPKPIVEAAAAVESNNPSLLDLTLEAAQRDRPTVTAESQKMIRLIEGVSIREVPTHADERGTRC